MKYLTIILLAFSAVSCNNEKPEDQPKPKPTHYDVKLNVSGQFVNRIKIEQYIKGERTVIDHRYAAPVSNWDTTLINVAVGDSLFLIGYAQYSVKTTAVYNSKTISAEKDRSAMILVKVQN